MFAALCLAACDRGQPDAAQEQGELAGAKAEFVGEVDRSRAGELMPAIMLSDPDGAQLSLGAVQGEPVLINLWATWCAPCIAEMPLLDELAVDYDGRLRVLAISQDFKGGEAVTPFFAERDFAALEPWLDPEGRVMEGAEANVLPTTILYDASGREVWRVVGDYDWSDAAARGLVDEGLEAP